MSGALISAVIQALTQAPLVLGDMVFTDFAIPEKVAYGIAQQLTVHKLIGGARVFDTTGPDPEPITFSGTFIGPFADAQAAQLYDMVLAAQPLPLSWGTFDATVVLRRVPFESMFKRGTYRVEAEVVPDPPPDDDDNDDPDLDDGEQPDDPQKQADQTQQQTTRARTTATAAPAPAGDQLPLPPVPPDQVPQPVTATPPVPTPAPPATPPTLTPADA